MGYFVQPTVVLAKDAHFKTMEEEIFGPVVTLYVYPAEDFDAALEMVDSTSEYALTGAVFARERYAIDDAMRALENAAGNFYINDKPTGAVVGQQPFGGARGIGNQRQGWFLPQLAALGQPAHHQGDPHASDRLPLPVPPGIS